MSIKLELQVCPTMPRLIPDTDFNIKLKVLSKNIEHTASFIERGASAFQIDHFVAPDGYRLLKLNNKHQYRMVTTGDNPETVYLVELRPRKDIVFNHECCTQIKVWSSFAEKHRIAVSNLPRMFFKHLIEQYNIVVTDEEQTADSRRFWETMLSWALDSGFYVYASDGTQEIRPLFLIKDMDDFLVNWSLKYWGASPDSHQHLLIVISQLGINHN